jgi:hypothetical protein
MGLKNVGTVKDTTDIELVHPATGEALLNDDGSTMTITVHGPYSETYRKVNHDQQNKRLMKAQRTGGKVNLTAEEIEASSLELLVKCTVDWKITLEDGKGLEPFDQDAARQVYKEYPWLREQVDAVFGDTRAFLE